MIRRVLILGAALTAILIAWGLAQGRFSVRTELGTASFGSLRLSGSHHIEPCQRTSRADRDITWTNDEGNPIPVRSPQPSPEAIRGRALADKGAQAFAEGRWAEAADYLRQALALMPGDAAVSMTLASAMVGLDMEAMARRADEAKDRRLAEDTVRLASDIDRLTAALDTLRHEACQSLLDHGRYEAAVRLPARADFVIDSSVVDLRHVRQGVVDFEAVKSPGTRTGNVGFSTPVRTAEPPQTERARALLSSPAIEAVIFDERMGEAVGYKLTDEERQERTADPVQRAVADHLGIDLGHASASDRALVERKTREMWSAYDKRMGEKSEAKAGIANQSLQTFNALMDRLKAQGLLKPGENLQEKEKNEAWFRDLIKSEVSAIVLEEETNRRETDRNSFDKMLGDVGAVLGGKGR